MIASRTERRAFKPRYRAEDLVYEAWEATRPRREALAREALALWPDGADANDELEQLFAAYAEDRVPGFVDAKALGSRAGATTPGRAACSARASSIRTSPST